MELCVRAVKTKHTERSQNTQITMDYTEENQLSNIIIGCAIEVHKQLGPGLLESAYQECLQYELIKAGLEVIKEKPMPIIYKDVKLVPIPISQL